MKEFISRLGAVLVLLLVTVILIAIVTSPFTIAYAISFYNEAIAGWFLIGVILPFVLYLSYVVGKDILKALKWLFIDPFRKK